MADVRYLIVCDEVRTDPANHLRLDVKGLMTHMRSTATPSFPLVRPQFLVLVVLTDCRGQANLSLRVVQSDTGRVIFRTQPRRVRFAGSPQDAVGITFRLQNCSFPAAGLYWVQLLDSDTVLATQTLTLKT